LKKEERELSRNAGLSVTLSVTLSVWPRQLQQAIGPKVSEGVVKRLVGHLAWPVQQRNQPVYFV
jgi:hypothetical protein